MKERDGGDDGSARREGGAPLFARPGDPGSVDRVAAALREAFVDGFAADEGWS